MQMIEIGEVCEVYDGPHATPKKIDDGPIYLGIDAITDEGKINPMGYSYLSEDDFLRWTKRVTPQYGDLVFSYEATLGRYALIPKGFHGCLGRRLAVVRPKDERINIRWLYYFFLSPAWKAFIDNNTVKGSTVNRISIEDFPKFKIPLIDRLEQDRIAAVLSALDDKIDNNIAVNDNLENQIQTIYDYWFSQFDFPNSDGNPYKLNGGLLEWKKTLQCSIPPNWSVGSVAKNSLTKFIKPGVDVFESKTYLATADIKGSAISEGTVIDYENRESRANMQPTEYSVWFAKMKNSIKHLYLNPEMYPIIEQSILSTGFCGLQCDEKSFEYVSSYIASPYFELHKDMLAHGATQEAVNNDDLAGIHLLIPDNNTLEKYHETTQPIYAQIAKNICENKELKKLRDWLLPMLMNGQATIKD